MKKPTNINHECPITPTAGSGKQLTISPPEPSEWIEDERFASDDSGKSVISDLIQAGYQSKYEEIVLVASSVKVWGGLN